MYFLAAEFFMHNSVFPATVEAVTTAQIASIRYVKCNLMGALRILLYLPPILAYAPLNLPIIARLEVTHEHREIRIVRSILSVLN